MGSISTGIIKDNNCIYDMNVYLEKMNYFPGETIQGLIQLTSNNYINYNFISSLKIIFILKNIEYWQNRKNPNYSKGETPNPELIKSEGEHQDDKNHYIEKIIILKEEEISNLINIDFKNKISNKNEITMPIKIELPEDMKPNLEWSKDNNIYCYSRTVFSINIPNISIYSNYYLFIQKKSPSAFTDININKIIGKKSLIFFWDNDNIKIEAFSQKNAYSFSDIFPLQITIDTNELKTKLNSIIITLKRKIKFLVNGDQSIFLNTSDYIDNLWEKKIILKNDETSHFYEFNIPLIDNEKTIQQKEFNFIKNNLNNKYLSYIIPPYDGQMIKCDYFIKIKPNFEGSNISFNTFTFSLDIYHNQNYFNEEAVMEINNILFEINKMQKVNFSDNNNINNINVYSSSVYPSLPDEEMLKKFYATNRGSPPVVFLNK